MSTTDSDFAWLARLVPVVVVLVVATLAASWFVWLLFARGFGQFPYVGGLSFWLPLGGFLAGTVRWTGLLLALGYVVRRATD